MSIHKSSFRYAGQLVGAGWQGLTSVRQQTNTALSTPRGTNLAWTTAAVGAAAGFLAARVAGKRRGTSFPGIGGAIGGSILGLSAGAAWSARRSTNAAVRAAIRNVNAVRDAHWLELNPIDYA